MFETTAATKTVGTATVASGVLETSNGMGGGQRVFGYAGTGGGKTSAGGRRWVGSGWEWGLVLGVVGWVGWLF